MAKLIKQDSEAWRVKVGEAEYELSLPELKQWIAEQRVHPEDQVRPPVTRRWKLASNAAELSHAFALRTQAAREDQQRVAGEQALLRWQSDVERTKLRQVEWDAAEAVRIRNAERLKGKHNGLRLGGCLIPIVLLVIGVGSGNEVLMVMLLFLGIAVFIGCLLATIGGAVPPSSRRPEVPPAPPSTR